MITHKPEPPTEANKPAWRKGDLLAMPQDLNSKYGRYGSSIAYGCCVFVAEHDPEVFKGEWCYGGTTANCFRPATVEDLERLIEIVSERPGSSRMNCGDAGEPQRDGGKT